MKVIGISGVARSGKDTLGDQFISMLTDWGVKCQKISFANQLKEETDSFLKNTIGISSFTEDDDEKKIIRPFLVTWGTHVRRKLDPDVWIKSLADQLKEDTVAIVCDVRFENELNWIKSVGGHSVYVNRIDLEGNLIQPANKDEQDNTVKLSDQCDHFFTWSSVSDEQWLEAIAYEVLKKTVPVKELEKWIQTCH